MGEKPESEETYLVIGILERDTGIADEVLEHKSISREVRANSETEAKAIVFREFKADGWKWLGTTTVHLISEPERMRRLGAPTLFDLDQ